jgi:hypothetical protein
VRLWSIHPRYLDPAGLVALWREGLLAQKVLRGETRGYRSHPQLERFAETSRPVRSIGAYLAAVAREAESRGYRFDRTRLVDSGPCEPLTVTAGQLAYEWGHLLAKLEGRAPSVHAAHGLLDAPDPHPLFVVVEGGVASWERPANRTRAP